MVWGKLKRGKEGKEGYKLFGKVDEGESSKSEWGSVDSLDDATEKGI